MIPELLTTTNRKNPRRPKKSKLKKISRETAGYFLILLNFFERFFNSVLKTFFKFRSWMCL